MHQILLNHVKWLLDADDVEGAKSALVSFNEEHDTGKQYLVDHLYNHIREANKIYKYLKKKQDKSLNPLQ